MVLEQRIRNRGYTGWERESSFSPRNSLNSNRGQEEVPKDFVDIQVSNTAEGFGQ